MKLKSEEIEIHGTKFTVSELPVKVILPLVNKMGEDNGEGQFELLGEAVSINGKKLGAEAGELGAGTFMPLIKVVMRLNGMNDLGNGS
jgi:hypothetical protein